LKRLLRAATEAGHDVARVEIGADKITLIMGKPETGTPISDLDRELQEFEIRHGQN
jgi:hypothetical protein